MGDERFLSNVFKRFLFLLRFLRFSTFFIFFCTFFTSMGFSTASIDSFSQIQLVLTIPIGLAFCWSVLQKTEYISIKKNNKTLKDCILGKEKKGKEGYLYSAFIPRLVSMCSDMDHTVLPANYTMPAFPS